MKKNLNLSEINQVTEIELTYKLPKKTQENPRITSSQDAHKILKSIWNENKIELNEEFKIILLNQNNRILGFVNLSSGGVTGTVVDIKHIIASLCKANASAIILAHNHPSGNLKPSKTDIKLTKKIKEACKLIDVNILDHLIITSDSYYSFADEGLI